MPIMEWGEDGKIFIFDRNDLGKPLTPSTPREEIKPGQVCGVAKTWQPYFREKSKEELDKVVKGATFCVYTRRGTVKLPEEAITICSLENVGAKTTKYRNAFTGRQELCPGPDLMLVVSDKQEAIYNSQLIGPRDERTDPECDCTDALLAALWTLQMHSFHHIIKEVFDIAMEEENPLDGVEAALCLSTKYKNLICNPEFWKTYTSRFPKLKCVIDQAYPLATRFDTNMVDDVAFLRSKERNEEDQCEEDGESEDGESEDESVCKDSESEDRAPEDGESEDDADDSEE